MTANAEMPDTGKGAAESVQNEREPLKLRKRIGSTEFIINVRFSGESAETIEDKILRLIEREADKIA